MTQATSNAVTNVLQSFHATFPAPPFCRKKWVYSWFEGSPTRGSREICGLGRKVGCRCGARAPAPSWWNALQMAFQAFYRPFTASDSWSEGNRLVVWGKPIRGLGEIHTWFEGNHSWFEGSGTRGLREITRGLREICDVKVLQNRGAGSWFPGPLLFKSLLFLFVNKNRERNVIVCRLNSETMGRIRK